MRRVLHVIETMAMREGGPPRVVAGLAIAQRARGIDARVLCGDGESLPEHLEYWCAHAAEFPTESVYTTGGSAKTPLARLAALHSWLHAHLSDFDVVHVHQLWRLVPTVTANACRRLRTPYLIAPHTSLSRWALAQKKSKKALARYLVWNRIFRSAAAFHALNDLEATEIRECIGADGPPVFVVPNGVSLREFPAKRSASAAGLLDGILSSPEGGAPFVLFLARLHTMKGPDLLLEAFAQAAKEHSRLQLVYAGPDFGMLAQLQRRAGDLGLVDRVRFLGLVSGKERLWLLNNALCLCQPSRDEGFSLSILEAMACARPVVISDRCKFPEVCRQGAGVIVPLSIPPLTAALRLYAGDPARRDHDGQRARELVEKSYTWDIVAGQAEHMYAEAIKTATRTPCCEAR